jgi:hypothetical protein
MRLVFALIIALLTPCLSGALTADQQNTVVTKDVTVVGTITRIDRQSRSVNVSLEEGGAQTVYVDRDVKIFDDLKVGDVVTVRYVESIIVAVTPGARMQTEKDTTAAARRGPGGENIELQAKAVVTIDRIDVDGLFISYRTADGRRVIRGVENKSLLEGLRAGDRVEITFTRERAVSIEHKRR